MKPPSRPPPATGAGKVAANRPVKAAVKPVRAGPSKGVRKGRGRAPSPAPQTGMRLHTADGMRKYLTAGERDRFLRAAEQADRPVRTLCMTLAYAGCRLSEALALTADRVDMAAGVLVFESLKKRRTGIFRAVPIPPALLDVLDMVHGIREQQGRRDRGHRIPLWPWSRMTGWRAVHAVMQVAGLEGVPASPKGLRHGFGVAAVTAQKWLGHAPLSTTVVYAKAVAEKDIARRIWG
jgi:integrase/recombinase XerD